MHRHHALLALPSLLNECRLLLGYGCNLGSGLGRLEGKAVCTRLGDRGKPYIFSYFFPSGYLSIAINLASRGAHCSSEQLGWSLFCRAMNNTIPARTLANLRIPGWAAHVSEGGRLRSITLTVDRGRDSRLRTESCFTQGFPEACLHRERVASAARASTDSHGRARRAAAIRSDDKVSAIHGQQVFSASGN
jgi:hypothetical protein